MNRLCYTPLLLILVVFTVEASAETIDRIAVVVDDEVVTFNDLRSEGRIQYASSGRNLDAIDQASDRDSQIEALLEEAIKRRLLVLEADKMRAPVGEKEVDAHLQRIYAASGQTEQIYRMLMAQAGIPWTHFRSFIRDQLKAQFVIRAQLGGQVHVKDADIEDCARDKLPGGEKTVRVTLRQILVVAPPEDSKKGQSSELARVLYPTFWDVTDKMRYNAAAILHEMVVRKGADFENVATVFSAGPSRERGGLIGTYNKGDLAKEFDAVFELDEGQISEIIETSTGFHIVRIEDKEEAQNPNWNKTLKVCRAELMQVESAKLLEGWLDGVRSKNFVEVKLYEELHQP